ncbi:MAG: circadian clock KaiB family protein [Candidatus Manganitrophus sp.]|nr:circadian clock KaiB family protein [Candidatus Manganitrophus sp.]MDC4225703.1 circadian clock KaiB family protein [Candidatus Manganitrophus sp.]WDT72970.1 MAG: circadian clock KaiB family protein [Candidatus Manganitrophus sp.]WDT74814.1 MAG: circadian clock KaiB family protein [Candidatus Manganitrophus sp.]WDT79512.1 MAG: circadian clock KaiB family protein [Candidatus Manganitrophus sp.]
MKRVSKKTNAAASMMENFSVEKYQLRLFVTGTTPQSTRAIMNIREICETHLKGRYNLEIYDLYQQPSLAKKEGIIAVPTLIKRSPLPPRRLVGDLSSQGRVLLGLGITA